MLIMKKNVLKYQKQHFFLRYQYKTRKISCFVRNYALTKTILNRSTYSTIFLKEIRINNHINDSFMTYSRKNKEWFYVHSSHNIDIYKLKNRL